MTGNQIEAAKRSLPPPLMKMTPQQRRLREELSCREMINSCLVYGSVSYNFYDPRTGTFGRYADDHVKTLGKESVIRLFNEQARDFSKAIVLHSVYTDSEGCVYNFCKWEDEQ